MFLIFVALLIAIPVAELYVIFQVAHQIGVLETVFALLAVSFIGGWIVRRVGMSILARGLGQLAEGRVPTDDLINGGVVLVAGALMFTPGFLTDIVGLLLLLPPLRAAVRVTLRRRVRRRIEQGRATVFGARFGSVVDAEGRPVWRPSRRNELE